MVTLENRALMKLNISRCRTVGPSHPEQRWIPGVAIVPVGPCIIRENRDLINLDNSRC